MFEDYCRLRFMKWLFWIALTGFLFLITLSLTFLVAATPSITLNSPGNNTATYDISPSVNFTVIDGNATYSCELIIDGSGYGRNTSVSNNTATIMTVNTSLFYNNHSWRINCTNGSVSNISFTYTFNVTISTTVNMTFLNATGNLTNMTVCYNTTAGSNMTLMMEDLGGDCNYGVSNASGRDSSIKDILFPRNESSLQECNLTLRANSTAGVYCILLQEDEEVSESNLAAIIAASAIAIITIIHALRWDSIT